MLITTEKDRQIFIKKAIEVDLLKKPWVFEAKPFKKDRNVAQNRLLYKWLNEIAMQSGNGFGHERGFYKFNYGCPILCRDDDDFNQVYMALVEIYNYEEMISIMSTGVISVSSIMKIKQCAEYLTSIEQSAFERGFQLTHPDDYFYEAMGIEKVA